MLEQNHAQDLCQQVLKRCGKDPAEVVLVYKEQALTRFANNAIHQNVAEQNLTIYLRMLLGKRLGTASTNQHDPSALDELVSHARINAKASPEDPNYPGLAKPAYFSSIDCFDLPTAVYAPEKRADQVGVVCRLADENGLNASGAFTTGINGLTVSNTQDVFAHHTITEADFQTVVMAEDSSGRAQAVTIP